MNGPLCSRIIDGVDISEIKLVNLDKLNNLLNEAQAFAIKRFGPHIE